MPHEQRRHVCRLMAAAQDRTLSAAGMASTAVFVGVIAAMGAVPALPVPALGVPVTVQSMGVMLAGAVLGRWRGALAVLVFLGLVATGLPLLSGGRGGLGVFVGPSVGFLVGFPVAAFLIGWLTELAGPRRLATLVGINILGGVAVLHLLGALGLAAVTKLTLGAALVGNLLFLPGDLVKAVLAALVAVGVHRALPDLLPGRRVSVHA